MNANGNSNVLPCPHGPADIQHLTLVRKYTRMYKHLTVHTCRTKVSSTIYLKVNPTEPKLNYLSNTSLHKPTRYSNTAKDISHRPNSTSFLVTSNVPHCSSWTLVPHRRSSHGKASWTLVPTSCQLQCKLQDLTLRSTILCRISSLFIFLPILKLLMVPTFPEEKSIHDICRVWMFIDALVIQLFRHVFIPDDFRLSGSQIFDLIPFPLHLNKVWKIQLPTSTNMHCILL